MPLPLLRGLQVHEPTYFADDFRSIGIFSADFAMSSPGFVLVPVLILNLDSLIFKFRYDPLEFNEILTYLQEANLKYILKYVSFLIPKNPSMC